MATLQDLLDQKNKLEELIREQRRADLAEAVTKVRALISEYGLTQEDIFRGQRKLGRAKTSKVAAKYRDPATGKEWSGRGLAPKWMNGRDKSEFLIK
jgi:DNA-binding protein H-NS